MNIQIKKNLIKYDPYQYYVENNILNETFAKEIQEEILGIRNPWRAEWLDADFKINIC
jgi:hypothetical protein